MSKSDETVRVGLFAVVPLSLAMLAIGFVTGLVATVNVMGTAQTNLLAERACHPGMLLELTASNRAVCIGGQRETWVVEVP